VATLDVRYARAADNGHLAYSVLGPGPIDVVEVGNGTNISFEAADDQHRWGSYVERLSAFARVIRFDPRGIGLSDPLGGLPQTCEAWAADTVAVIDAAGAPAPAFMATGHAGPVAIFVAATHPERVRALVLVNTYARLLRAPDYPQGLPADVFDRFAEGLVDPNPVDASSLDDLPLMAPSRVDDASFRDWWRAAGHRGASPATALAMHRMAAGSDVRALLARVQAPTLVLHSLNNRFVQAAHGQFLAEHLPTATHVELNSDDHLPWAGDADFVGEIEQFLTGTRGAAPSNRRLAAVLFTDIVQSTNEARRIGDQRWRDRLDQHDLMTQRQVTRFGGQIVKATGDGVLATFDGPARAVECALALHDATGQIGVTIRAGVHVGEIEQRGADIAGIAVHIAQRICSASEPGETLVSRTVTDLTAGSGIEFDDRGGHQLKGLDGTWHLYRAHDNR